MPRDGKLPIPRHTPTCCKLSILNNLVIVAGILNRDKIEPAAGPLDKSRQSDKRVGCWQPAHHWL